MIGSVLLAITVSAGSLVPPCGGADTVIASNIAGRLDQGAPFDAVDRTVRDVYDRLSYCPIWSRDTWLTSAALDAFDAFRAADVEGLDPRDYGEAAIARGLEELDFAADRASVLAELDVELTRGLVAYAIDRRGRIDSETLRARTVSPAELAALADRLEASSRGAQMSLFVEELARRSAAETSMAWALGYYRSLGVDGAGRSELVEINLERMRWISAERAAMWILINIPAHVLTVYRDGLPALEMKVIVGTKAKPTPVFDSAISEVTVNPPWNVPAAIARKEIWPLIRRDPAYAGTHGFRIFERRGEEWVEVEASQLEAIDSGSRDVRLVQTPGAKNALGRLRFVPANPYCVYLHDTPAKNLFDRTERDLSHGCIRVEKPLELAELLTGLSRAELEARIASGRTSAIAIDPPIPIHVVYWTATANDQLGVDFHPDIYRRDAGLAARIRALRHHDLNCVSCMEDNL